MILNFDSESGKMHFEFVFEGFVIGGSIVSTKGLSVLRRELSILDKLESISHEKNCGKTLPGGEKCRELNSPAESDLKIELDNKEFDILYNYISSVPWATGQSLRNALYTIDWLSDSSTRK